MPAWNITPADILFPLAVMAIWAFIFLLMLTIVRWAAHDHDSRAEAEEASVQKQLHGPSTPLPA
jgi:hypothetical protein